MKRTFLKLLAFFKNLFTIVLKPFALLFSGVYKIIIAVLHTLVTAPAELMTALAARSEQKAKSLGKTLDAKQAEKREANEKRGKENEIREMVGSLLKNRFCLKNRRNSRIVKIFLIVVLEIVSFGTTYRGLLQCTETLGPHAPFLLAIAIQVALGFLASTISVPNADKGKLAVLGVVLVGSISMSYMGVAESLVDYGKYAEEVYTQYQTTYQNILDKARQSSSSAQNAAATVDGQYDLIDMLLQNADKRYGADALATAQDNVSELAGYTTTIVVPLPTYVKTLPDGQSYVAGGGSRVETTPDPAMADALLTAKDVVTDIEAHQKTIQSINALLGASLRREQVKQAVTDQSKTADDSNGFTPEFTALAGSIPGLVSEVNGLAADMGNAARVDLNLTEIVHSARQANVISGVQDAKGFSSLRDAWRNDERSDIPDTGSNWFNALLETFSASTPTKLKELVDEETINSYTALKKALGPGQAELTSQLEAAYAAYGLENPLAFAIDALNPNSALLKEGLIALTLAIINDGLAVLIGALFEDRRLVYAAMEAITPGILRKHIYEAAEDVITPIIAKRLSTATSRSMEDIAIEFANIIGDFVASFEMLDCPQLEEDFSGCAPKSGITAEYRPIYRLLLRCGFLKSIRAEEAASLGLVSSAEQADKSGYLLLTNRGDAWLAELLGSTGAYTLPDLIA